MEEAAAVTKYDVVIVGAGFYGLVAARNYLRLRPQTNLLIVDSNKTVGGVWCKERLYPNLIAQVPEGFFNYTDTPMPPQTGISTNGLIAGETIHEYLQTYAEQHDLLRRICFSSLVARAERCSTGWKLHCQKMEKVECLETTKLIVATGITSMPKMPRFRAQSVSIPIIHSKDLGSSSKSLESPDVRTVVVVGGAKSAYDTVYLLLSLGKKVIWIIRADGTGPHPLIPQTLFGYWRSLAVSSTRFMSYVSPSILNVDDPLQRMFQRTNLGLWCTNKFWEVLNYLSIRHAGYSKGNHVSMLKPYIEDKSVFWGDAGVGLVTLPDFWAKIHDGDVSVLIDKVKAIEEDTILLESGTKVEADYIVMCTGWGDHFKMFDQTTKLALGLPYSLDRDGLTNTQDSAGLQWEKYDAEADISINRQLPFLANPPKVVDSFANQTVPGRLYRRVVPLNCTENDDRSIIILGQIHTVQTPLVADIQSFWGILYLLGEIKLPSEEMMVKEISEWNAWSRKRYLNQGQKTPYSLFDFLPYLDSLFRDMGLNSRRKSNFFSEIFSPYQPEDFNGFIGEYLEMKSSKTKQD
ncbi:uncharacterized protein EAE98_010949 [Botrytis deweyae]|uniref:L-ornithine N(5)-oxygenase n=1 Tax=Botrytis deweyae TaxID=2478750 RepID=A0ABQ7I7B6_9HELO|nr:uncharacterized protein EAE98_010949 [Botrytis deweyae]KAF7915869.1 hypothetical protein EAE98_010949 [Botrytis deweyae]